MKKILLIVPLFLLSCKKDVVENTNLNSDSVVISDSSQTSLPKNNTENQDSLIANSPVVERVLDEGVNRNIEQDQIIRTADASMFPFTIGDQFTKENQRFVLKITNVKQPKLKISVESKEPMNIRINQIKKPDGTFDGPFGKTITLDSKQAGEYWVIIGKNQMADGNKIGHFTIKAE